jgi:hypothetical protein
MSRIAFFNKRYITIIFRVHVKILNTDLCTSFYMSQFFFERTGNSAFFWSAVNNQ